MVRQVDQYAKSFDFWLPGGDKRYPTYCGASMTIISLLVLCFYAYMQSAKLNDKPVTVETDIVTTGTREQFFGTDFVYSENLMFAFGLTAFDNQRESIEDPSFGVVKAYYESWGSELF